MPIQSDCEYIRTFSGAIEATNVCICKHPLTQCTGLPCDKYQAIPVRKLYAKEEVVKCVECEEDRLG